MKFLNTFKGLSVIVITSKTNLVPNAQGEVDPMTSGYTGIILDEDTDYVYMGETPESSISRALAKRVIDYVELYDPAEEEGGDFDIPASGSHH